MRVSSSSHLTCKVRGEEPHIWSALVIVFKQNRDTVELDCTDMGPIPAALAKIYSDRYTARKEAVD